LIVLITGIAKTHVHLLFNWHTQYFHFAFINPVCFSHVTSDQILWYARFINDTPDS